MTTSEVEVDGDLRACLVAQVMADVEVVLPPLQMALLRDPTHRLLTPVNREVSETSLRGLKTSPSV